MKQLFYSLLCMSFLVSCTTPNKVYDKIRQKVCASGGEIIYHVFDDINRVTFCSADSTFYYQDLKSRKSDPQEIICLDSEVDVVIPHVAVNDEKSSYTESTFGRMTIREAMKAYSCDEIVQEEYGYWDIKALASALIFTPNFKSPDKIVVVEDEHGSHNRQPIMIYFINNPGKLYYVWMNEYYHTSQANSYTSAYIDLLGEIEAKFQDTPEYVSLPEDSHYPLYIPSALCEDGTVKYGDKVILTSSGAEFPSSVLDGDERVLASLRDSIWCYCKRQDEAIRLNLLENYFESCEAFETIYELYKNNPIKARQQYPVNTRIRAYARIDKISQSYAGDYMLIKTYISFNEMDVYTKDERVIDFETPCYVYFEGDFDIHEPGLLSWDSTTYYRFHNATIVGYQHAPLFGSNGPIMIVDDSVIHKYRTH